MSNLTAPKGFALAAASAPGFGQKGLAPQPALAPGRRVAMLVARLRAWLTDPDFCWDLADDIGSARWFRSLGVMLGLGLVAASFWPNGFAVAAPPEMRLDATARDEMRSQTILPLALGADSGRRMGPGPALVPLAAAPSQPRLQLTATLGQGDSFMRMLTRAGVGAADAAEAGRLVGAQVPLDQIVPGTRVAITLGPQDSATGLRPLEHLGLRARFDLDLSISRAGAHLVAQPRAIAVDTTPLRIRGTVGTSVYLSARAAGAPIEAIQQYLQVLDQHLDLDTAIAPGDTFDIIVAAKRSAGGESRIGQLLYAGLERDGKPQAQLLRWGSDGQFFEASGMGARRTGLIMPVFGHITSSFGARRHPILGYTRMHAGVDFGAAYGSPIYAVGDAVVSYAGWHGGHGNYVRLDHGGGFATGYGHMSRIAVAPGGRVRAGQVIGYVGSTGLSTGPHLHYELYQGGVPVNPLSVRFTVSNQVDPKELAAYKARLVALKAIRVGMAPTLAAANPAGQPMQREIDRLGN